MVFVEMRSANEFLRKLRKGIKQPGRIFPYLLGQLFPDSRWGPHWELRDGNVLFKCGSGGFAASTKNRPQFAANLYYEVTGLTKLIENLIDNLPVDSSLEIGCGYGRLTPWISEFSNSHYAIDPNEEAVAEAKILYPSLDFEVASVNQLPYEDSKFSLIFTWTVLQHIHPDKIALSAREMKRVLLDKGVIIICEKIRGSSDGVHIWTRDREEYMSLFSPLKLIRSQKRPVEPTYYASFGEEGVPDEEIMCFR